MPRAMRRTSRMTDAGYGRHERNGGCLEVGDFWQLPGWCQQPVEYADSSRPTSFQWPVGIERKSFMTASPIIITSSSRTGMRPCADRARNSKLLPPPDEVGLILDVACGIGTQSLALAAIGYSVEGSDISAVEIARAQREATSRGLKCSFRADDMRTLKTASVGRYGAIIAMDNALPHLDSDDDILATFAAMRSLLDPVARCSSAFAITLGICKKGMHACRPSSTATTDSDNRLPGLELD